MDPPAGADLPLGRRTGPGFLPGRIPRGNRDEDHGGDPAGGPTGGRAGIHAPGTGADAQAGQSEPGVLREPPGVLAGQFGAARHPVRSHSPRERAVSARRATGHRDNSDPRGARPPGGSGLLAPLPIGAGGEGPEGELRGADPPLPGPPQEVRRKARMRHLLHRGVGVGTGAPRRPGAGARTVPGPAPWHSLGSQGSFGGPRISNHLGSHLPPRPDAGPGRHGGPHAGGGGRGADRQAQPGSSGRGRRLVRREDPQSLEAGRRLQGLIGRFRRGDRHRPGRLLHRVRDHGVHRLSVRHLRSHRPETDFRTGQPSRRHDSELEPGQAGPHLPQRRGLRPGVRRHPRARSPRPDHARPPLHLACKEQT